MAKKLFLCITLMLFVLSASVGTGEQVSSNFEAESQSSLVADYQDPSSDVNRVSSILGRLLRAKSSIKNLPSLNMATQESSLVGWTNDTSFSSPFSKPSVYQQISVYRL
jgi:hypothetical protein